MPIPIYAIFEGGGAKGIAHIAAVKACEAHDLEIIGVAGASAGAVIASLVAVGYKADEIFDPQNPYNNLLATLGATPIDLLGREDWTLFTKAQHRLSKALWKFLAFGYLARFYEQTVYKVAKEIKDTGGYFQTEEIRRVLNELYRKKLADHYVEANEDKAVPDRVTFGNIAPKNVKRCCSLKVIATDVTRQKMVIFDSINEEYAAVEVAEAVAASIAIPAIFKPAQIKSYRPNAKREDDRTAGRLFADGGIISNMPLWVFSDEKLNYERTQLPNSKVKIVAFGLKGDSQQMDQYQFAQYWPSIARTSIFGGQQVVEQFIPNVLPVKMQVNIGVTEFDFTMKQAISSYEDAQKRAEGTILRETIQVPDIIQDLLKRICEICAIFCGASERSKIDHLRAIFFQPANRYSLSATFAHNAANDADDRAIVSNKIEGVADALREREPIYLDFAAMWAKQSKNNMTKYEFALIRRGLRSAICIPIFDSAGAWAKTKPIERPRPLGVISLDSDLELCDLFHNDKLMQRLAAETLLIGRFLKVLEHEHDE